MSTSQNVGQLGEDIAAKFLVEHGCKIVKQNYHSRFGEIDIIARNATNILFVEVKTRVGYTKVLPKEAVDILKQKKIVKTAMMYISEHDVNLQPRFDVIEVLVEKISNSVLSVNHIENAFFGVDFFEAF